MKKNVLHYIANFCVIWTFISKVIDYSSFTFSIFTVSFFVILIPVLKIKKLKHYIKRHNGFLPDKLLLLSPVPRRCHPPSVDTSATSL